MHYRGAKILFFGLLKSDVEIWWNFEIIVEFEI